VRLVHLSDLHLGFRRYQRMTSAGINQREADVAQAFIRTVDAIIARKPDLIVFGGDIFHVVRPSNTAIVFAYLQVKRLVEALPEAILVMVAGNHDTPRTREMGSILSLFTQLGVHVADREPKRFTFPSHDLSVLAVPEAFVERPALTRDEGHRFNVLVLHGEIAGQIPAETREGDRATAIWQPDDLTAAWDYIALGHYHVYQQIRPNAWYSGAIEYTSLNPWAEQRAEKSAGLSGKGFIEHDLSTKTHQFHVVPGTRRHLDLPAVDAAGLTAPEVDAAIDTAIGKVRGGIDDAVVRLFVNNLPKHIQRELDPKRLREYRARALNFQFEPRKPDAVPGRRGEGAPGGRRTRSLADLVTEHFRGRALDADLDRDALGALALQYLAAADDGGRDVATPEPTAMPGDDA
jgi:hypothetical protein